MPTSTLPIIHLEHGFSKYFKPSTGIMLHHIYSLLNLHALFNPCQMQAATICTLVSKSLCKQCIFTLKQYNPIQKAAKDSKKCTIFILVIREKLLDSPPHMFNCTLLLLVYPNTYNPFVFILGQIPVYIPLEQHLEVQIQIWW